MATGIFLKPCPACATLLPREASGCECGYLFDADEDVGDESQQLAQEELFETYLTARLQQALADLEAARATLATAPTDTNKAYAVLRQVQTLQQHRAELQTQQDKVAALRARVGAQGAPTDEFRTAQAVRAAEIVERNGTDAVCRHCGATIPAGAKRCSCAASLAVLTDPPAAGRVTTKPTKR